MIFNFRVDNLHVIQQNPMLIENAIYCTHQINFQTCMQFQRLGKIQQIFHSQFCSYIAVNLQLECILQVVLYKVAENNKHLVLPVSLILLYRRRVIFLLL